MTTFTNYYAHLTIIQMPVLGQYVCRYEGIRNIGSTEKYRANDKLWVDPKILINIHTLTKTKVINNSMWCSCSVEHWKNQLLGTCSSEQLLTNRMVLQVPCEAEISHDLPCWEGGALNQMSQSPGLLLGNSESQTFVRHPPCHSASPPYPTWIPRTFPLFHGIFMSHPGLLLLEEVPNRAVRIGSNLRALINSTSVGQLLGNVWGSRRHSPVQLGESQSSFSAQVTHRVHWNCEWWAAGCERAPMELPAAS